MKQQKRLYLSLGIIFGIMLLFIIYLSWPLMVGKSMILATRPVDPFDLFRGQYIVINYEISNIPILQGIKEGDAVFVVLKKDKEGVWRYESASFNMPERGDFIKGTVKHISGNNLNIEYGIEQYFFERNAQFSQRNLQVEIKVDNSGYARIVQLMQDRKPLNITYPKITLTS